MNARHAARRLAAATAAACVALGAAGALALPDDRNQPIYIQSDFFFFYDR